jgi:hypothetical protein
MVDTSAAPIYLATPGTSDHYVGNWIVGRLGSTPADPLTIEPASGLHSAPILDGNNGSATGCATSSCSGSILNVESPGYLTLDGLTIENAHSPGDGGGIDNGDETSGANISILDSTFSNNEAMTGGAIDNAEAGSGTVRVSSSTFSGNSATQGGAIENALFSNGTLTVSDSTFANNHATVGGAIDDGEIAGTGPANVVDTTFSGNSAAEGADIDLADFSGESSGTVRVAGDLFADGCFNDAALNPGGVWTDGGYNVGKIRCFDGASTDIPDASLGAQLDALAYRGGRTETILPLSGNPGIGLVPDHTNVAHDGGEITLCPMTDQTGHSGQPGTACNVGSVGQYPSTINCAAVSGSAGGTITFEACSPPPSSGFSATIPGSELLGSGGSLTWTVSPARTTTVSVTSPSPGQGACAVTDSEFDVVGVVTSSTTLTTPADTEVSVRLCESPSSAVSLVPGTNAAL